MIGFQRLLRVERLPARGGRDDVDHRQPVQPLRMVEREAVADAGAPVVSDQTEADMAKLLHHRYRVLRHQALRVERAVFAARRAGPAIAAQIHENDGEPLGQFRRDLVPFDMSLRIAMQQQKRRSVAVRAHEEPA